MTPPEITTAGGARRITASELGTYTLCQHAGFLANPREPTALGEARHRGATDHAARVNAVLQGQRTARIARLLLILGLLAPLCVSWLGR
jgi:hypothetical protein